MYQTKKHILVVFSLFAFLMNVVMPYYAAYSLNQESFDSGNSLSSIFGDKILICTSSGYKWVSVAEFFGEENDTNDSSQHGSAYDCPLCYLSQDDKDVDIDTFYSSIIFENDAAINLQYRSFPSQNASFILLNGGYIRAPPSFV